ncbi:MAG: hypothetical protein ACKVKF_04985 [Rhodobacterales bacterium]|uniref:hypothetical protein n=1 Tax=Puniceibacterium antarcticum TaxID=1206336 RepID=UPI003CCBBA64
MDSNGEVLDIPLQSRRNERAAKRFIAGLVARCGKPRVIIAQLRCSPAQGRAGC